jgi:hypothetical protein
MKQPLKQALFAHQLVLKLFTLLSVRVCDYLIAPQAVTTNEVVFITWLAA